MIAGAFEIAGSLIAWLYSVTHSYALSVSLLAVIVMGASTPLVLKSTRSMLEMQTLAPEMKLLQQKYKDDRATLNAEMMKLYQEHKVNPMASCFPMAAQAPVFIIMFRILHGLTFIPTGGNEVVARAVLNAGGEPASTAIGFFPRYINHSTELYQSLVDKTQMMSFGLDLSKSPADMLQLSFGRGMIYIGLVVVYGVLSLVQQRMVAARATMSPTMSEGQQKLMQYMPVAFAIFEVFFLLALVIYYIVQTVVRIAQQAYITRRFYGHEESVGRLAQAANQRARDISAQNGESGGGLFARARRELDGARGQSNESSGTSAGKQARSAAAKSSGTARSAAKGSAGNSGSKPAKKSSTKSSTKASTKATTQPKGRPTARNAGSQRGRPQSKNKRNRRP